MSEFVSNQPPIVLSPGIVDRVDVEFRTIDYDTYRSEEVALLEERNFPLFQLYAAVLESNLKHGGEDESKRGVTGFLFAHRVLRYGNNDLPLPNIQLSRAAEQLLNDALYVAEPGEPSLQEKNFNDKYKRNPYVIDAVNKFRFVSTKFAARLVFVLYGDTVNPEEIASTGTNLGDAIDAAYREIKAAEYDAVCDEELALLMGTNSHLGETLAKQAAVYRDRDGEEVAKKFTLGLVLAHRILRYARQGEALPQKTDHELSTIVKRALQISTVAQPNHSKLEAAFRERFSSRKDLVGFVYETLKQPMCRFGVEQLLLMYADEVDQQVTPNGEA